MRNFYVQDEGDFMTNINIQDELCWCCKVNKANTVHHAIPQHMKPKQNVVVPICSECHKKINNNDLTGMYSFAYKIMALSKEVNNKTRTLTNQINKYVENGKNKKHNDNRGEHQTFQKEREGNQNNFKTRT